MTEEITNSEDLIDSRDIIARLEDLREDDELEDWEKDELEALTALDRDGRGLFSDSWEDGVGLIRDSYFEEHARQYAEDIGAISNDARWPANCIDWNYAAEQLKADYTCLEFDGVEYWAS